MKPLLYISVFFLGWALGAQRVFAAAADTVLARTDTSEVHRFRIYYPVNKTRLYPNYMSNPQNLEVISKYLSESPRIDSIIIYSYASPEGPYDFNARLARERGLTAKKYLLSLVPSWRELPDSVFRLSPKAENWEGLREEVWLHYREADRAEVLEILDSDLPDAEKKVRLQQLNGRLSWQYILRHIMPRLRYATWISVWSPITPLSKLQGVDTSVPDSLPGEPLQGVDVSVSKKEVRTLFALKTNLLYDVVTLGNFSVEVPFGVRGHDFSVLYQHHFPWWTWGEHDNEYCIRFLSMGGEARWWFRPGDECLTGWYVGLYGMGGKWDFEWKRDICHQGEFWSTGLSVGYAMPICSWANLEFGLSVGYASIPYRGYTPTDDYSQLVRNPEEEGTWHYIGPTKAEVSLSIPIRWTRTFQWKKGGAR